MKDIILTVLGVVVIVAILFFVYWSVVEGFEALSDAGSAAGDVQAACKAQTTCSDCLGLSSKEGGNSAEYQQWTVRQAALAGNDPKKRKALLESRMAADARGYTCGWCAESNSCIPRVSTYRLIPKWLTDLGKDCSAKTFIYSKAQCPDIKCGTLTNCRDCAGNIKCGWSTDSNSCVAQGGSGVILVTESGSCPAIDCSTLKDCAECTNTTSCGYCNATKSCVTLDKFGVPPPMTCTQDTVLTGPYQCPGATPPSSLSGPVDTRTAPDPTDAQLAAAQDTGFPGANTFPNAFSGSSRLPESNTPVSPATSYTYATAPGVAVNLKSSSIPASVRHDPALGDAPLESYVKMLVNSHLAAQGVPTNEPFQVNETIENASEYMKKEFKEIFGK